MKTLTLFTLVTILLSSCGLKEDITKKDSPTSGKLILFYDEGLTLHIENQVNTFKATYGYADIVLKPSNERECIEALFKDSCKAIAISRGLSEKELQQFKSLNINPQSSVVARTGIAFIVHKDFQDSTLSIPELVQLLTGNDSSFIPSQHIKLLFDNQNSGATRQLKDSLIPSKTFGKNCSASNNTLDLVMAVSSNCTTIGVCDYAWFSDQDDRRTQELLKSVKILAVSKQNSKLAYMPDQSNLATGDYPFTRSIHIIRRSAEFSLGKGIETFIAGPSGQLMFLKQGLAPNRQEERVIEIDMTPLEPEKKEAVKN